MSISVAGQKLLNKSSGVIERALGMSEGAAHGDLISGVKSALGIEQKTNLTVPHLKKFLNGEMGAGTAGRGNLPAVIPGSSAEGFAGTGPGYMSPVRPGTMPATTPRTVRTGGVNDLGGGGAPIADPSHAGGWSNASRNADGSLTNAPALINKTKPVTAAAQSGWKGGLKSFGEGLNKHLLNADEGGTTGIGHIGRFMGFGAAGGLVGGVSTGVGSIIDPETVQSNGILKPMMQGAWKGAIAGAVHAGAGGMTKAASAQGWSNAGRYAKMTTSVMNHAGTKAALMAAGVGGGGNISLTKPVNTIK
jgi:hypothetical protein